MHNLDENVNRRNNVILVPCIKFYIIWMTFFYLGYILSTKKGVVIISSTVVPITKVNSTISY